MSGRPGPVHLTIPLDVLEAEIEESTVPNHIAETINSGAGLLPPDYLEKTAAVVEQSHKPLIIAGSGVFYGKGQHSLVKFSENAMIPIVTPIWDRGVIDRAHPNFLGVTGAASGEPRLLEDADLIILAGARVDYRIGYLRPPKVSEGTKVIRIDRDVCELNQGVEPTLGIAGDLPSVFDLLAQAVSDRGISEHARWLKEAQERSASFRSRWQDTAQSMISGWHIVKAVQSLLNEEVILLIDGGNIGQWAHMLLATERYPASWLTCGASGVVGLGLPGAMAARLAYPDKPVLLVSGDGSFGFTTTELESAVRQKLPFVAIVANDKTWGIAASVQYHRYGDEGIIATRLGAIRYDKIAEACGAQGMQIHNPQELTRAIKQGFSAPVPVVIDVPITPLAPLDIT
ncbi:MAG: thiamine pyrophosphate-binding protein [Dehalococcoidales bacterium]|nr:thiamine pyrophosphate-binding protein [Dehalococcoidales bacterium]